MRVIQWLPVLVLLVLTAGCGTQEEDFETDHTAQQTLTGGEQTTVDLLSGAYVTFPAATIVEDMIIVFSDLLTSSDGSAIYYPTATQVETDMIGAVVINTPADRLLGAALPVRIAFREGVTAIPGAEYVLYRFDFYNLKWNQWGGTIATVDAGGAHATFTLPTTNFRGFIGSLALFVGHTSAAYPPGPTQITGTVVTSGDAPVQTDVGLYILVGARKYPAAVAGTGARIPNLPDPVDSTLVITVANTVDSGADGTFTIVIPDNLIGQLINLEFGHEDPDHSTQDRFDVLTTGSVLDDTMSMVIQYGANSVRSRPVGAT